jgi:hypothetical protein
MTIPIDPKNSNQFAAIIQTYVEGKYTRKYSKRKE